MKMKYRTDVLVIAVILILALSLLAITTLTREEGAMATVKIGEDTVAEYSLSVDGTYPLNGGTNILTISGGVAYMSYSECRGHHCEKMGKIRYVGEFIECAPNHIRIVITGSSDNAVDFVS